MALGDGAGGGQLPEQLSQGLRRHRRSGVGLESGAEEQARGSETRNIEKLT